MSDEENSATGESAIRNPQSAMFRALAHRNFRLFWAGALVSNLGSWMQALAQGYVVYELTRSSWWLGVDGFMTTAPGLVLTLLGGVFADLLDKRRLLILTQLGAAASALTLAGLAYSGGLKVWMILALSLVTGSCMSLAGPSFQALMLDLVGREDLPNAIALNSAQFQFARMAGPSLAGLSLATLGTVACFLANGLSFFAVIAGLWLVQMPANIGAKRGNAPSLRAKGAIWRELMDGFRYVRQRPRVFSALLLAACNTFFGAPYLTQLPLFARDVLHAGEAGLSALMAASGAGAFCGALLLAFWGDFHSKGKAILGASFLFGVAVIGFALSPQLEVSLAFLLVMGFSGVSCFAMTNTLIQQLVTDEMRGRVMSMLILTFVGVLPFSSLATGAIARYVGAPLTLASGGVVMVCVSVLVALTNKRMREAD